MNPSVVFAGGGCRAFWSLGVWHALSDDCPEIREWAGVSAGSAMAIASATGSAEEVVEEFCRRTAANARNLYPTRALRGQRMFPHEAIYRATIATMLTPDRWHTLMAAGPVRILHAYIEPGRSVPRTVFGALMAYRRRRKLGGVHGPETPYPGVSEEVAIAQEASAPDEVIDHVLSSSASPPVTATPRRDGRVYFDGSLVDNVPLRALSNDAQRDRVLILLTRPASPADRPDSPTRLYLAPNAPVPIHKWDYASPDRVRRTFELGLADGRHYRDRVQRFLESRDQPTVRPD